MHPRRPEVTTRTASSQVGEEIAAVFSQHHVDAIAAVHQAVCQKDRNAFGPAGLQVRDKQRNFRHSVRVPLESAHGSDRPAALEFLFLGKTRAGTPTAIWSSGTSLSTTALPRRKRDFRRQSCRESWAPPMSTSSPRTGTSCSSWRDPIVTCCRIVQLRPITVSAFTTIPPKCQILRPGQCGHDAASRSPSKALIQNTTIDVENQSSRQVPRANRVAPAAEAVLAYRPKRRLIPFQLAVLPISVRVRPQEGQLLKVAPLRSLRTVGTCGLLFLYSVQVQPLSSSKSSISHIDSQLKLTRNQAGTKQPPSSGLSVSKQSDCTSLSDMDTSAVRISASVCRRAIFKLADHITSSPTLGVDGIDAKTRRMPRRAFLRAGTKQAEIDLQPAGGSAEGQEVILPGHRQVKRRPHGRRQRGPAGKVLPSRLGPPATSSRGSLSASSESPSRSERNAMLAGPQAGKLIRKRRTAICCSYNHVLSGGRKRIDCKPFADNRRCQAGPCHGVVASQRNQTLSSTSGESRNPDSASAITRRYLPLPVARYRLYPNLGRLVDCRQDLSGYGRPYGDFGPKRSFLQPG